MVVKFIKQHPSGFEIGSVIEFDDNTALGLIDVGLCEKSTKEAFELFQKKIADKREEV